MKKNILKLLLVLLLAVSAVVSFSACGGKKNNEDTSITGADSSSTPSTTDSGQETGTLPTSSPSGDRTDPMNNVRPASPSGTIPPENRYVVSYDADVNRKNWPTSDNIEKLLADDLVLAYKNSSAKNISVYCENLNVDGGLKAVSSGRVSFGIMARALTGDEKSLNLKEDVIGYKAVAVIVNPTNSVKDLTVDQIKKIFTGGIKDWSQLGGSGGKIRAYIQLDTTEDGLMTINTMFGLLNFKKTSNNGKGPFGLLDSPRCGTVVGDSEAIDMVSKQDGAISFMTFKNIDNPSVYAVDVNGVEPSVENVKAGKYGMALPVRVVSGSALKPDMKALLDFTKGSAGQKLVTSRGIIPVK